MKNNNIRNSNRNNRGNQSNNKGNQNSNVKISKKINSNSSKSPKKVIRVKQDPTKNLCAEVFSGLEEVFSIELMKEFGGSAQVYKTEPGLVYFRSKFDLEKFYNLKIASSLYIVVKTDGNIANEQNSKTIASTMNYILSQNREYWGENLFETFKVSAKKATSPDFIRLKKYLSIKTNLGLVFKGGDLVLKCFDEIDGIFVRITPRPLSVRFWREANFKAALNASIASAMIFLTRPKITDKVLNICAGSGTLTIERALFAPPAQIILGIEKEEQTFLYSKINLKASQIPKKYKIIQGDCTDLNTVFEKNKELLSNSNINSDTLFNVILGDLPFGMSVGHKKTNTSLYKKILRQTFRVLEDKAKLCLITQDIASMTSALNEINQEGDVLLLEKKLQIKLSTNRDGLYIYPMIFLFTFQKQNFLSAINEVTEVNEVIEVTENSEEFIASDFEIDKEKHSIVIEEDTNEKPLSSIENKCKRII